MAKSIYEILNDYQTETSTPNGMIAHTLPAEILPTAEQFENAEDLLKWAEEKGITHAVLQKGVQKFLIELRAVFKAVKKGEDWTPEKGQKAVNEFSWEVTKKPGSGSGSSKKVDQALFTACLNTIISLTAAKMKKDKIILALEKVYNMDILNACFDEIEKAQAENQAD